MIRFQGNYYMMCDVCLPLRVMTTSTVFEEALDLVRDETSVSYSLDSVILPSKILVQLPAWCCIIPRYVMHYAILEKYQRREAHYAGSLSDILDSDYPMLHSNGSLPLVSSWGFLLLGIVPQDVLILRTIVIVLN
ncbi:hypothetical protein D9757_014316 [Collybiopsis confluens]|uniref:Uncharacterized protein n=1 Tax=Collybiopsis confluens TaxID=2823264 RepID=A0A8H5CTP6_9AGAR|nr:hypothetical protein D9757_014316 [Collybiopsis confluens]